MRQLQPAGIITAVVIAFLWLPILVLVINSFNASRFSTVWGGFSLIWYERLITDAEIWRSVKNTAIVAAVSTSVSVVLGTLAGFVLDRYKSGVQATHNILVTIPLIIPDILMGISLLVFFLSAGMRLGLGTIILGHITFCISYVAITIRARLQDFDYSVVEAAQDLGANWPTVAWKVYFPMLLPGIISGALLSLTLSLDDFIITFFTAGPGSSTLPVHIYSMIRHGNPPVINALSTLFLALTFMFVLVYQRVSRRKT
ncbi:MAG: ABC transporter permease [Spirochaetaceae bacterium]|nr:MAG: ABC transporter permease [Spirochaetaceae bacterium]